MKRNSFLQAFRYALKGIGLCLNQRNFRIHLVAFISVVLLGLLIGLTDTEWLFISLVAFLVLITESLNTALEYFCDVVHPEYHLSIGKVKDIGAGAVLLSVIAAVITGVIIFLPKLWKLI
jgi:diacylglycerol kinase